MTVSTRCSCRCSMRRRAAPTPSSGCSAVAATAGAAPALDEVQAALATLQAKLSEAASSPKPEEALGKLGNLGAQLALALQRLPEPVTKALEGLQQKTTDMGRAGARQQLN